MSFQRNVSTNSAYEGVGWQIDAFQKLIPLVPRLVITPRRSFHLLSSSRVGIPPFLTLSYIYIPSKKRVEPIMSADLKRVRAKQDEGYLSPVSKKRALAGGAGPSGVGSGQAEEEEGGMEDWMKVVEVSEDGDILLAIASI